MATGVVTGYDSETKNNPKTGRPMTIHKIIIDGTAYECGFKKPSFGIGNAVEFDSLVKYGKAVAENIRAAGYAATTVPTAAPKSTASGGSGGRPDHGPKKEFPVPLLHPDRSIIRQNALGHATKLYCDGGWAVNEDDLAKAAEKIIEIAYQFEEYASGQREVNALKAEKEASSD